MKNTPAVTAAPLPQRPASLRCAPVAQAERFAAFGVKTLKLEIQALEVALIQWRDREALPLSDGRVRLVAAHAIAMHAVSVS